MSYHLDRTQAVQNTCAGPGATEVHCPGSRKPTIFFSVCSGWPVTIRSSTSYRPIDRKKRIQSIDKSGLVGTHVTLEEHGPQAGIGQGEEKKNVDPLLAYGKILSAHMPPEFLQGCYEELHLFAGIWHQNEATVPAIFKISESTCFLEKAFLERLCQRIWQE